jgi:hypothetical protein
MCFRPQGGVPETLRPTPSWCSGLTQKGVEGTYDRGPYFRQKSDALAKLAAFITRITEPSAGNVVQLRPVPEIVTTGNKFDCDVETVEVAHG